MFEMSFLERGKEGFRWIAAPLRRSVMRVPGCAMCGRNLVMNSVGLYPLSGKCDDCVYRLFDEDEVFDDLEY